MTPAILRVKTRKPQTRYSIAAEARFRVTRNGAVLLAGRGRSVEMTADHVLMELDAPVAPSSHIELALIWPGIYHGSEHVRLRIFGQVLSCETKRAEVRILRHEFEIAPPRATTRPGYPQRFVA